MKKLSRLIDTYKDCVQKVFEMMEDKEFGRPKGGGMR